jgi:hypothetical protein
MAGQRYSRILEAAKLYSAVDNYIKYITDSAKKGARVGSGKARAKSIQVYVRPFAIDLPADVLVRQTCAEAAYNSYQGEFAGNIENAAGAATILKLDGFKAARAIITTGRSPNGQPKTSAVTGLKYLSYGGQSTSIPFGNNAAGTDQMLDVFNTAKAGIIAGQTNIIVSLQEEKV